MNKKMSDAEYRMREEIDEKSRDRTYGYYASQIAMQWICGLPATKACVYTKAKMIRGSRRASRAEGQLLVTLAGFAYQTDYGKRDMDYDHATTADLTNAFRILEGCEKLLAVSETTPDGTVAVIEEADVAFKRYFEKACRVLETHMDLIDFIKSKLRFKWNLSAEEVARIWIEYEQSTKVEAA